MPFELLALTEATLTTFTGRTETHGKATVSAVSFRLRFSGPNTLLDLLSASARKTFYEAAPGQEDLPGVDPTTPHLRSRDIKQWSPENAYEGWTVTVDYGYDEAKPIEMGGCKIDDFKCDLHDDPGMVDIECRIGTSNLDWMGAGRLWSKQRQKVHVMLAAPLTPSTNPEAGERDPNQLTLDGTTGSEIGEPSDARKAADAAFQPGSEGMDPGKDWPFPRHDAAGNLLPGPDATDAVLADVEANGAGHTASPIAYQDEAKPSRTWTGKGKMPAWLKQALATGKTLADFQVKAH